MRYTGVIFRWNQRLRLCIMSLAVPTMPDNDPSEAPALFEPFAVQEIPLDGFFSDARIQGNTFRCTAFSMQSIPGDGTDSQPVAVVRLVMTTRAARQWIEMASAVLREGAGRERVAKSRRRRV